MSTERENFVGLSSALLEGQPEPETLSQAVLALEQSLLSLESVEEVRFLVDGELARQAATRRSGPEAAGLLRAVGERQT